MFEAFVYKWTDNTNEMQYIGFHKGSIDDGYIGSGKHFKAAYKKHPECFTRAIIGLGTVKSMRQFESQLLKEYDVKNNDNFYNMRANEMHYTGGQKLSTEQRAKLSAAQKGRVHSEETRAKIGAAKKGKTRKPFSEEWRAKMSAALKGKPGRPQCAESRAKIGAAHKGKVLSAESRAKISAAHKGNTHSAETKRKISNSLKKRNLTIVNKTEQGRIPELRETEE
jgi:hypothetical protein